MLIVNLPDDISQCLLLLIEIKVFQNVLLLLILVIKSAKNIVLCSKS